MFELRIEIGDGREEAFQQRDLRETSVTGTIYAEGKRQGQTSR